MFINGCIRKLNKDSDGLVARSQHWSPPDLKPDSTEELLCLCAWCTLNLTWVKHPPADVLWKVGEGSVSSGVVRPWFKIMRSVPK
ncbi:hypothetical protein AVEN_241914-1 [Araneus ventricosus]|uniref:Uncharacterized protein n=1 Tax=Araneus ventricosus TaxID=182803 RepID=A0A4Y2S910_ARAVE|nr:hypothetical protein AVEN_202918-1 [Araneus ventricosus]GBN80655.1 hypothetical protein AVEN_85791-1 [Araneus ventricosus]GBN84714.1 hypothetical protein AVEN_133371-1 [Araneus ventricosus]GBN84831.1 hypothetical protein AVEN_241914-1 [Araneus ventricosus]